ncbi:DUF7079 family protein [Dokdonella ginsengisoli]|uniref:DUF7079 domain-containing protein n=1 Tax=Dokdonella ginsengisoli TaxID=363846 RepID=A0ABV9QT41_9GAMM
MSGTGEDMQARQAVWSALSDLYLDNSYRDYVRVAARELARSPYTPAELRSILFDEVHPVLARNLCAIVGVWDHFDQAWLAQRILANRRRVPWLRPRGRCQRRYAALLWRLLEPRVAGLRAATAPPRSRYDFNLKE